MKPRTHLKIIISEGIEIVYSRYEFLSWEDMREKLKDITAFVEKKIADQ